jgi:hypothetical protein
VADDLWNVLTRFHREVFVPDFERIVGERIDARVSRTDDRMASGFDAIAQVLSGLERGLGVGTGLDVVASPR